MTILVTGAAGFIGMHVAASLLASGARVIGIDNLNDYYDPALKLARLARLEGQPPDEHPIQHHPHGVQVGAGVDAPHRVLLGRHVVRRAAELPLVGDLAGERLRAALQADLAAHNRGADPWDVQVHKGGRRSACRLSRHSEGSPPPFPHTHPFPSPLFL